MSVHLQGGQQHMNGNRNLNARDLRALVQQAKDLSSEIDLGALLQKILRTAEELTSSESTSIFLYDEVQTGLVVKRSLYAAAATGPKAPGLLEARGKRSPNRVPLEGSIAGQVFRIGKVHVQHKVEADPDHFKTVDQELKYNTETMVCAPLVVGSDRIGVIQLVNKQNGNYDRRDINLIEHFAALAALAIRNAQLVEDLLARKGLFTSARTGTMALINQLSLPAQDEYMTVFFADMRGFTRLLDILGKNIKPYLNQFLTLLSDKAVHYGGSVNKFLGDGMLAFFREGDSEIRAVRCAFAIIEGFDELKREWDKSIGRDIGFLDVGFGIATGDVIIGSIGGGMVKDFTALGSPVNLAAAFEHHARGGKRVLIDQPTYNAVEGLVTDVGEPIIFDMRKPDQPRGEGYKCYNVGGVRGALEAGNMAIDLSPYYRSSWAILVGIDKYKSERLGRLDYAVADVHDVRNALPSLGFPPGQIRLLKDHEATKENITDAIYSNLQKMHLEDRLLLFFAVHGQEVQFPRSKEGFLLPHDTDIDNIPQSGLPMGDLVRMAQRLPPKHILIVLDCCFSGYAIKRDAASAEVSNLQQRMSERVIEVLTAGTSDQQVAEDGGHGLFTKAFLKGLDGWADPKKEGLTAHKLHRYIQDALIHENQTPQINRLDGEGEFLFRLPAV